MKRLQGEPFIIFLVWISLIIIDSCSQNGNFLSPWLIQVLLLIWYRSCWNLKLYFTDLHAAMLLLPQIGVLSMDLSTLTLCWKKETNYKNYIFLKFCNFFQLKCINICVSCLICIKLLCFSCFHLTSVL